MSTKMIPDEMINGNKEYIEVTYLMKQQLERPLMISITVYFFKLSRRKLKTMPPDLSISEASNVTDISLMMQQNDMLNGLP